MTRSTQRSPTDTAAKAIIEAFAGLDLEPAQILDLGQRMHDEGGGADDVVGFLGTLGTYLQGGHRLNPASEYQVGRVCRALQAGLADGELPEVASELGTVEPWRTVRAAVEYVIQNAEHVGPCHQLSDASLRVETNSRWTGAS